MTRLCAALRRRRESGQSAVEMCFILPVALLLFMGVYTAGSFISDMDIAGQAVRAGARLGAEIGNYNYPHDVVTTCPLYPNSTMSSDADPCVVDGNIITSVKTIARDMKNVKALTEIDIYDPCYASGSCTANGNGVCSDSKDIAGKINSNDPIDRYYYDSTNGWYLSEGSYSEYTLDQRVQIHPDEAPIAVRLVFTFQAAAPFTFFNISASQYAVMCLAPNESGG